MISLSQQSSANATHTFSPLSHDNFNPSSEQQRTSLFFDGDFAFVLFGVDRCHVDKANNQDGD